MNERDAASLRADQPGARLTAWLDGELGYDEATAFAALVESDPGLRRDVKEFRRVDNRVRGWYSSLVVSEGLPRTGPQPAPRRTAAPSAGRRLFIAGLAAAGALLVIGLNLFSPRSTGLSAAELVARTGRAIAVAPGMRVTFTAVSVQRWPRLDGTGVREEERTARCEIRFGNMDAGRLLFACRETWDATADEPVLIRHWGQTAEGQWLWEKQGKSVTMQAITGMFDPAGPVRVGPLAGGAGGASPVDPRTRQAVEGLAVLARSFNKDPFLKWLGGDWKLLGGRGTRQEPWAYRLEPNGAGAGGPTRTVWTLQITAAGGDATIDESLIDRIELRETITDTKTKELLSSLHTVYRLELRDTPWPERELAGP